MARGIYAEYAGVVRQGDIAVFIRVPYCRKNGGADERILIASEASPAGVAISRAFGRRVVGGWGVRVRSDAIRPLIERSGYETNRIKRGGTCRRRVRTLRSLRGYFFSASRGEIIVQRAEAATKFQVYKPASIREFSASFSRSAPDLGVPIQAYERVSAMILGPVPGTNVQIYTDGQGLGQAGFHRYSRIDACRFRYALSRITGRCLCDASFTGDQGRVRIGFSLFEELAGVPYYRGCLPFAARHQGITIARLRPSWPFELAFELLSGVLGIRAHSEIYTFTVYRKTCQVTCQRLTSSTTSSEVLLHVL
jgi:hypothetical protein